jgi:hypothetical protein
MAKCSPSQAMGHDIPAAVTPPHDQRAHGLPQDLQRSDEESADPPAATRTEPAETARRKPLDGDSLPGSAQLLLDNPRINAAFTPASQGAVEAAMLQGGANRTQRSNPALDTADFADSTPGNLRTDYVLPSRQIRVTDGAVFWPLLADPLSRLTGVFPFSSSDHRLVWIDASLPTFH